jgi:DNA-binding NarL/FixJ family response regulator
MVSIVLVTDDDALATRVRDVLDAAGMRLDDVVPSAELGTSSAVDRADVIVVGGALRIREGSVLRGVRERLPEALVVACAPESDPRAARWAVDNGADGVLWETQVEAALAHTVGAVHAGQLAIPREARRQLLPPELTNREKQVLSLVVMGLSNGEIAAKLYLTEHTVKSHLGTAFRKLGVRSRAEAARLVADPSQGLGTGIMAITGPRLSPMRRDAD